MPPDLTQFILAAAYLMLVGTVAAWRVEFGKDGWIEFIAIWGLVIAGAWVFKELVLP